MAFVSVAGRTAPTSTSKVLFWMNRERASDVVIVDIGRLRTLGNAEGVKSDNQDLDRRSVEYGGGSLGLSVGPRDRCSNAAGVPEKRGDWGGTRVEGLEPSTAGFVDRCSIQLSYTRSVSDGGL